MTNQKHGKGAVAAGAVAGAVVGAAAGAVLANDKTRKKMVGAFNQIKDKAINGKKAIDSFQPNTRKKIARIALKQ